MNRKNRYLRFCCFLTGLSFPLIRNSSEQSVKNAKKYTGALLIIMLVWFFIGYCFATRYLHMGAVGGVVGGLLMSFIILQIERIIILSHHISWGGKAFRILLGVVMAFLGAMIMDQFTFKDDIEHRRVQVLDERVKDAIKTSEQDIRIQVMEIDSMINATNLRYNEVSEEINAKPYFTVALTESSVARDAEGNKTGTTTNVKREAIPNPRTGELEKLNEQIKSLTERRFDVLNTISSLKEKKEDELKKATGFLDELILLKEVISLSWVGIFVYCLFLFFFLSLELFILVMKLSDKESDYDKLIDHQVAVRIKMLNQLNT